MNSPKKFFETKHFKNNFLLVGLRAEVSLLVVIISNIAV